VAKLFRNPLIYTDMNFEKYCILNPKTLEVLCITPPENYRCVAYFAETIFNPFTGRNPIGIVRTYETKEQAGNTLKLYPHCIIAKYNTNTNHISKV
jgi:hypothetical protein